MERIAGRAGIALLVLVAALLGLAVPGARAAEGVPVAQAGHLAERLRDEPVYISDQLPRAVPRSTAPEFTKAAQRTGLPTYVLVLPAGSAGGEALLDAVHDRLGRDGLYVLLDDSGVTDAAAYGVTAPADDAVTVSLYELPYDAGPLLSLRRFADVVAQGEEKAAARAEAAREKYGDGDEPEPLYIGPSDRDDQSLMTGAALTGVPLTVLFLVPYVRRWRRRLPGAPAGRPAARRRWVVPAVAVACAVAVAVTANARFDQTRSGAAPPPTPADMSARVERVAAGLKQDPVYEDPESPRVLTARQRDRLHERIRAFARSEGGGPVRVALVPQQPEDESAGDDELFAAAVHHRVGEDGVYVVADPVLGVIGVYNHGLRLDSLSVTFDVPEAVAYGDDAAGRADDHLMGRRLDRLMTFLEKVPRIEEPDSLGDPAPAPNPRKDDTLRPLFSGEFWPGLWSGAVLAGLLFALVAAVLALTGKALRRRGAHPVPTEALPYTQPTEPSADFLRRTARAELRAFAARFTDGAGARARNCMEAALLLTGGSRERLAEAVRNPGLDPATLVALIVLARAGRAALPPNEGEPEDRVCGVNPLHGPARTRRDVRVSAEHRNRRRWLPVCEPCRDAATATPASLPGMRLTLPDGGGRRLPYDESEGPLPAVRDGIPRLISRVRESAAAT
ncbi:hypothetical protein RKD49_004578 [Streptomyces glaucescens]